MPLPSYGRPLSYLRRIISLKQYIKENNMNNSKKIRRDFFLKTFPKGRLSVLAGKFCVGKTDFMISMARLFKGGIVYLSLQRDIFDVVEKIKKQEEKEKLLDKNHQLFISDIPGVSLDEVFSIQSNHPFSTVIIDYLELMNAAGSGFRHISREYELMFICQQLNVLAKKTNTRIIAISQMGRNTRPQKEDCPKYLLSNCQLRLFYRPFYEKEVPNKRKTELIEIISWDENEEKKTDIVSVDKETIAIKGVHV